MAVGLAVLVMALGAMGSAVGGADSAPPDSDGSPCAVTRAFSEDVHAVRATSLSIAGARWNRPAPPAPASAREWGDPRVDEGHSVSIFVCVRDGEGAKPLKVQQVGAVDVRGRRHPALRGQLPTRLGPGLHELVFPVEPGTAIVGLALNGLHFELRHALGYQSDLPRRSGGG